jgi:hypothetical protein
MALCLHPNLVKLYGIALENESDHELKIYFIMDLMIIDLRMLVFRDKVLLYIIIL